MNIFTIPMAIALFMVGGVTLVALTPVLWGIRKRSWKDTLVWVGISLAPMTALLISISWFFGPVDYSSQKDLVSVYHMEFGSDPPTDVTDIRARHTTVGDSTAAWLYFHASGSTIDKLLVKFVQADRKIFDEAGLGSNVPRWWKPDTDKINTFYTADRWNESFSYSVAYLGISRTQNIVYFHHNCFD